MADQTTELTNDFPLLEETIALKKAQISPFCDSSTNGTSVNAVDDQKHKCKKGRRKSGLKKHRAGRNRKRKYKPYHRLTHEQQKMVDERNEKRANRKRQRLHDSGVALAPLNTTQFLFNDSIEAKKLDGDNSDLSSLSEYDGNNAETDDFNAIWRRVHLENINIMPQVDLVQFYMFLEDKLEQLDRQRDVETKIKIFQEEIRKYEYENEALLNSIAKSTKRLKDMGCNDEHFEAKMDNPLKDEMPSADIGSAV